MSDPRFDWAEHFLGWFDETYATQLPTAECLVLDQVCPAEFVEYSFASVRFVAGEGSI